MRSLSLAATLSLVAVLGGCDRGRNESTTAAAPPAPAPMSIQDIMLGRIVPASNGIWMVAEPATDETWASLSQNAMDLIAAADLMTAGPHPLLREGQTVQGSDQPGTSTPAQIEQRISASPAEWKTRSEAMKKESQAVLAAVQAKDLDKVMEAGNALYDSCEACHQQFWHPEQTPSQ